ncbi:unnamed protein product [Rotaria sp. Silwood1]|nr:unnamed protein product [Rotaria sp. Silwood1]CAF4943497.1 unnamed protein product [Rotaria sp. Silwood1]
MNFSFPKVRLAANNRRFISPAVESLIKEIKKRIKNKALAWLFENCFPNTLDTTIEFQLNNTTIQHQPDTYVITGDIDAMWLRDSSAQVHPYLPLMKKDAQLRLLIEGVLLRQCLCIERDPYANAHYKYTNRTSEWQSMDQTDMRPGVHERKWELDSLCYVLRLMHSYWNEVDRDTKFFHQNRRILKKTIRIILKTMKEQQRFHNLGPYTYQRQGYPRDPRGPPARPNGLIHSFFRPSDDLQIYPYLVPSQFFAHHTLKLLLDLRRVLFNVDSDERSLNSVTVKHDKYGLIYAYEIDGMGRSLLMDDANVPSLLSLPYLCPNDISLNHSIYLNTRMFILSKDNPWFFKGTILEGVGGPHVGFGMVWPLAIIMRGMTSTNDDEIRLCLKMLEKSHANTGFMHESVDMNNPIQFTRPWFAWANSLFGEFIWKLYREKPYLLD